MTTGPDENPGERVLGIATAAAREVFADELAAVFALGSLAHGGFAPLASDIDIALILRELTPDTGRLVGEVARLTGDRADTPLAERLSVFWTDWDGVRLGAREPARLATVDRLDLLADGRLLHGTDERAGAVWPDRTEVRTEVARFAVVKFDRPYLAGLHRPGDLVAAGPRAASKAALFPIRLLYTLDTGRVGQNDAAADWYGRNGEHPELAAAAMRWRRSGIEDPATATGLLREHLVGVYDEMLAGYAEALSGTGPADLITALRHTRGTLHGS